MDLPFRFDNPRPRQKAMMQDIVTALSAGRDILINAPTGIGKTDASISAALSVAMEKGLDVFFLTPKISQHRIAVECLRGIRKRIGTELRYMDIVGKRNLCVNPEIAGIDGEGFYRSCDALVSAKRCGFYTSARERTAAGMTIEEAGMEGHNVLLKECSVEGLCAYEIGVQLAKKSRIIIADYAHLLNPYAREAFLKKISHRLENAIVIWDEAHNVISSAESYMSTSLSTSGIGSASRELKYLESELDLGYLEFAIREVASRNISSGTEAFVSLEELPDGLMQNISRFAEQVGREGTEYLTRSKSKRSSLVHIASFLEALGQKDDSVARIISRNGNVLRLSVNCLYPEKSVRLFGEPFANVFMSGTLLPLGMYAELFGLEGAVLKDYASSFPKENRLCILEDGVSTKYESRSNEEFRKIASKIEEIRRVVNGNIAVFFPSFAVMSAVYRHMENEVEYIQRSEMRSASVESFIDGFKKGRNGTLFGVMGGSLSEGIDYANNVIRGIIIVGIPLEKPTLELKAKIEYMNRRFEGRGSEYAYIIPGVIKAAQAAGRAIRSETDKAFVVFMDKRYGWRSYKSLIGKFMDIDEGKGIADIKRFLADADALKNIEGRSS